MAKNIYKTTKAIFHNVGNYKMKLFGFGLVSQNQKNAIFTKRVVANLSSLSKLVYFMNKLAFFRYNAI
jgi:hypothetical protein